jgi:hypothetical protein
MTESEGLKEQRKHKRFSLKQWVSGFCRTSFFGVGTLVDISRGGVAFQYFQPSGDDLDYLQGSIELEATSYMTPPCLGKLVSPEITGCGDAELSLASFQAINLLNWIPSLRT